MKDIPGLVGLIVAVIIGIERIISYLPNRGTRVKK